MKIKTYSIDSEISKEFDDLAKKLNLNKSSFIENKIREFLKENKQDVPNSRLVCKVCRDVKNLSYEAKYRIVER